MGDMGDLDLLFRAVAEPMRRRIIEDLTAGPATVTALAERFAISQSAISQHLASLERAGLVRRERAGRMRICHLETSALEPVLRWIRDLAEGDTAERREDHALSSDGSGAGWPIWKVARVRRMFLAILKEYGSDPTSTYEIGLIIERRLSMLELSEIGPLQPIIDHVVELLVAEGKIGLDP